MKKELALTQYVDDLTILHLQGTLVSAGLVINGINGNKWKTPFLINGINRNNAAKLQIVIKDVTKDVINGGKW